MRTSWGVTSDPVDANASSDPLELPPHGEVVAPMSRSARKVMGSVATVLLVFPVLSTQVAGATLASQATQGTPPEPTPSARIVAFMTEPSQPELGEVFALHFVVRLAPEVVAFFPDTLLPVPDVVSAGSGTWEMDLAPGDSIDVRATYPVIGLDPGGAFLPFLELWTRAVEPGERPGPRALEAPTEAVGGPALDHSVLAIGGAVIMPLRAMTEAADGGLFPRPPADVLGGGWSPALVAAVLVGAGVVVLLAWLLLAGRGSAAGASVAIRPSPRAEALSELDRLRTLGWHTNGRVVDFYEATTGVLRRFADRTMDHCGTFLTSTELVGRLTGVWGEDHVADLRDAVWSAERVKFASLRPTPAAAEADWETVRRWITELPEGR